MGRKVRDGAGVSSRPIDSRLGARGGCPTMADDDGLPGGESLKAIWLLIVATAVTGLRRGRDSQERNACDR